MSDNELVLFRRLPLGARFRYQGGSDVWVVLERHGMGLIAEWKGNELDFLGQSIACAGDTQEDVAALKVELVLDPLVTTQNINGDPAGTILVPGLEGSGMSTSLSSFIDTISGTAL